ncbi:MAG: hypothetical protein ACR2KU_03970 [Gammaproteobacteria bacterium]|nr:hypothetical protein [Gammaproteobacteria bacterium]
MPLTRMGRWIQVHYYPFEGARDHETLTSQKRFSTAAICQTVYHQRLAAACAALDQANYRLEVDGHSFF